MCHDSNSSCPSQKRCFRCSGGNIVQCLSCGSIGVEIGTSYLVFSEPEFFRFAEWFETLSWENVDVEKDRMLIRLRDEAALMLSLSRHELHAVSALLSEGTRWVANNGLVSDYPVNTHITVHSGATVH